MTEKIKSIRDSVRQVDHLLLLSLCNKVAAWEQVVFKDKTPPIVLPGLVRAGEYLQSVIVATECTLSNDQSSLKVDFGSLLNDVADLYSDALLANVKRNLQHEDTPLTVEQRASVMTMQNMYNVRGKRDASFQHHFHDFLIRPHDEILKRIYGVSADSIVQGLDRMLDSTRTGLIKVYTEGARFRHAEFYSLNDLPPKDKLISLFDVQLLTKWPQQLIEDLSLGPGDDTSFYKGDFAGSPQGDLPIKDRPFVKIAGRIYAFSYYMLADYFYRALQRCIEYRCPQYDWSHPQASATEAEAKRIFNRLLPNAEILTNNHYHPENNPNLEGENDLIVSLGDVVIIVEVKGRKRWHSPPCWNSKAFLKGNFNDIKAAIEQCRKTERYINMSLNPVFYDSTWTQKKVLDVSGCRFMLKLVVVLDGINEITSSLSSLRGVAADCQGVLCISFDDLLVYEKYFEGAPALFLDYLNERLQASTIHQMATIDELDHLAAYIGCPRYVAIAKESKAYDFFNPGSFEELSDFFAALNNPGKGFVIPRPTLPRLIWRIVETLGAQHQGDILAMTQFFVGMPLQIAEALQEFVEDGILRLRRNSQKSLTGVMKVGKLGGYIVTLVEPDDGAPRRDIMNERRAFCQLRNDGLEVGAVIVLGYNGALDSVHVYKGVE